MNSQSTELLSKREASGATDKGDRSDPRIGKGHLILLFALLALGTVGSFVLASRYAGPPEHMSTNGARHDLAGQSAPAIAGHEPSGHADRGPAHAASRSVTLGTVEREWGVRVTRLTLIADGGLVDLRYQVTDPESATRVFDPEQQIYLLDEASGEAVATAQFPKLGDLRSQSGDLDGGRAYFVEFRNPDELFETGDLITLAVGPHRLQHVPIR